MSSNKRNTRKRTVVEEETAPMVAVKRAKRTCRDVKEAANVLMFLSTCSTPFCLFGDDDEDDDIVAPSAAAAAPSSATQPPVVVLPPPTSQEQQQQQPTVAPEPDQERKYIGVYAKPIDSGATIAYVAQISVNGAQIHLGRFATREEAARAYDQAVCERHLKQRTLNFPEEAEEQPVLPKKYRGVTASGLSWRAKIRIGEKWVDLGVHRTIDDAALAYDKYVRQNNLSRALNFGVAQDVVTVAQ